MKNKAYQFEIRGTRVEVEADVEGECRYMVRLSIPGRLARTRIGYLTGREKTWLAEFFGKRASVAHTSAKEACHALAQAAVEQNDWLGKFFRAAA